MSYMGYKEEGDICPECHKGVLDWSPIVNCRCHINPPCSACTDRVLVCPECEWEDDRPDFKMIEVAPGLAMREYAPKPLDTTKVSWRSKMHSNSSMIKEGVFPLGTSREALTEKIRGTFGGRFEYCRYDDKAGHGKFKYIAYTD